MLSRGERINNPFNIEKNNIKWQGMLLPGADATFCQFDSPITGLRAGFLNLKNQLKENFNTVKLLVTKYAPPNENDTKAYINAICKRISKNEDDILTEKDLLSLGKAIIIQEQGRCNYTDDMLSKALEKAGVPSDAKAIYDKPSFISRLFNTIIAICRAN